MSNAVATAQAATTTNEDDLLDEVLAGLTGSPKAISPKFFYDEKGSQLFDQITELDEYYLTRTEYSIFDTHRDAICEAIGNGVTLVEPGAGSCEKVRWLLSAMQPERYVPMDISGEHLMHCATGLREEFPLVIVGPNRLIGGNVLAVFGVLALLSTRLLVGAARPHQRMGA